MALVFVRKLLDFFFTKRELSYLDDIMPESKRKREDDKKKEAQEKLVGSRCRRWRVPDMWGGNVRSVAVFQEEDARLQEEEELGLKVGYDCSNRVNIPVKTLSGR